MGAEVGPRDAGLWAEDDAFLFSPPLCLHVLHWSYLEWPKYKTAKPLLCTMY